MSRDDTFDEDSTLGKERDLSIVKKYDDHAKIQEEPWMNEPMLDVYGLMDWLDPPPYDLFISKKIPLWLWDTLKDAENYISARGNFRESKNPTKYQGYLAAMNTII